MSRNLRVDNQSNISFSQFFKRNGTVPAIGFINHPRFSFSNISNRLSQITVPLHGIHRKIKMGINNEHIVSNINLKYQTLIFLSLAIFSHSPVTSPSSTVYTLSYKATVGQIW